jgi:hypothetical protein
MIIPFRSLQGDHGPLLPTPFVHHSIGDERLGG